MKGLFGFGERRGSIRSKVLLTVGTALLFFAVIISYILINNMFDMLSESEKAQMHAKNDIVASAVATSRNAAQVFAADWAGRSLTQNLLQGQNADRFQNFWTDNRRIHDQKYNFIVVKDLTGQDLFTKYYDYFADEYWREPEGFSGFLSALDDNLLSQYAEKRAAGIFMTEPQDGFVFFAGQAYYLCAMPVTSNDEKAEPIGTLFVGRIFSEQEIARTAKAADMTFEILAQNSAEMQAADAETFVQIDHDGQPSSPTLQKTSPEKILLYTKLPGFFSEPEVILKTQTDRTLYQKGLAIIKISGVLLFVLIICLMVILFHCLEKFVFTPVEMFSKDVQAVADSSETINTDAYNNSHELNTLSWSINSMLERLTINQEIALNSTVSLNIMQNILDALDTYLFVSDIETGNILFVNDKLKSHFHLSDDVVGRTCEESITFCVKKHGGICSRDLLAQDPTQILITEEEIPMTGRHYRLIEQMIDWIGGKKAYLHYLIDITELKEAEALTAKRLQQEKLMSAIAQHFITAGDMTEFMDNTLAMTGQFMNVSRILLAKYNDKSSNLELQYVWAHGKETIAIQPDNTLPLEKYRPVHEELVKNNYQPLVFDGTRSSLSQHKKFKKFRAFLTVPLYVGGKFWGILEFYQYKQVYQWDESEIMLGKLIGGMLSSVLSNKSSEEELFNMKALINSSPQYIAYVNADGEFYFVNPGAAEITGYSREELMDNGIYSLYSEENNQRLRNEVIPSLAELGEYNFEIPLIRKDGQTRIMSFSAFAVNSDNKRHGCIASDITERKELEQNLIEAKDAAEKASRAKGEFLSRMSHEMRTPMNAIIGMTNIAKNAGTMDKKQYCLDKIDEASKHLLGVINDILDMSKIEADKFELSISEFELEQMMIKVTSIINFRVEEKKQTLQVYLDDSLPHAIIGDEQRLAQVLTNLLSNAVKFTPEHGRIDLSVKNLGVSQHMHTLQFEVVDTGIGITPEQQKRLFTSFEQADTSIARKYGGTGLGLAISKRIVELMNGQIWIEPERARGTKITFTIQVREGSARTNAYQLGAAGINKDNLRILAVDDSYDTREYFLHIMQRFGFHCDVAADGFEALEMVKNKKEAPYNVFFIDWMMPGLNGIELTRKIRQLTQDNAIIFMISIAEWREIEQEATSAGVNQFISKPLFPSILFDSINACLGTSVKIKTPEKISSSRNFSGHTILIAEDVIINQEIMNGLLDDTGVRLEFAANGREAVEMFEEHSARYSLIFMDLHMPEMDGYEATRVIRSLKIPRARTVPIVAMTANVFREDIEKCLAIGMNDHVGKPIDVEELFYKMQKYLSLENSSRPEPRAEPPQEAADEATEFDYEQLLPAIDVKDGLKRVMDKKEFYFMLLKSFKGEQLVSETIASIGETDFVSAKKTAHALKGTALNLGLIQLAEAAKQIEAAATSKSEMKHLAQPLQEALEVTLGGMKKLFESEGV